MNHDYSDIRAKIAEKPTWFDEHAVPRYCEFTPDSVANIYAESVALVQILCQSCHAEFHVAFSYHQFFSRLDLQPRPIPDVAFSYHQFFSRLDLQPRPIPDMVADKSLHYGDPPNVGCCPAGATMNSIPVRVLEYWKREGFVWVRVPELEIEITPDWAIDEAP
jgi:hypothetical protein